MGAASSAVSKTVIDKITGACTIQFSPANTSPDFTTYDDNGLYFRTAPSDLLQGRVLANLVLDDGNETASVLYRQESYGSGLAESFKENFEGAGGVVDEFLAYAVDTESFDAEVDAMVEAGSTRSSSSASPSRRASSPRCTSVASARPANERVRRRRQHRRHRCRARRPVDHRRHEGTEPSVDLSDDHRLHRPPRRGRRHGRRVRLRRRDVRLDHHHRPSPPSWPAPTIRRRSPPRSTASPVTARSARPSPSAWRSSTAGDRHRLRRPRWPVRLRRRR